MSNQYAVEVHEADDVEALKALASDLTEKQRRFADWYARTLNGTEAAGRAGYAGSENTLSTVAWENLRKPKILRYLRGLLAASHVTPDELIARLGQIFRADLTDFYSLNDAGEIELDLEKAKIRGSTPALKKIRQRKTTRTRQDGTEEVTHALDIDVHNPLPAARLLAKIYQIEKGQDGATGLSESERALLEVMQKLNQLNSGK